MRTPVVPVPRVTCIVGPGVDLDLLPMLAEVGIDGFQVRAKEYDARRMISLTRTVRALVHPAVVTVNDRVDVAVAAGAEGVHLGADDLPVAVARRIAPELLIGATCRSRAAVSSAAEAGADYVGFGPVFTTSSKAGLPDPLGVAAITDAAVAGLPLIAIGGISSSSAGAARSAGAHGVAVIGSIWRHPDPVTAAKELVAAVGA